MPCGSGPAMLAYLIRRVCRRFVTGLWEPLLDSGTPPLTRTRKGQPVRSGTRAGWSSSTRALNRAAESPEHALALICEVNLLGLPPWPCSSRRSATVPGGAGPGLRLSGQDRRTSGLALIGTAMSRRMFTVEGSAADLGATASDASGWAFPARG